MALSVVYDACVLFPAPLRDLLMRIAHAGLVRARWTHAILDECFYNICLARPELDPSILKRTRQLMIAAIPECIIEGYEPLIEELTLPDPNDRHVLAAAIHGGASTIVTRNLRDFPAAYLSNYEVEARHPDDFVFDLIDAAGGAVANIVVEQAAALRSPPRSPSEMLTTLRNQGLVRSVAKLHELLGPTGK